MAEKSKGDGGAGKRGRPPFKPTIEQRQTVEQMKFCGESDNVIARALCIDPDTLRKHFEDELADGHAHRRKEVIGLLFGAARDGNVTAIKRLEEMGRISEVRERRGRKDPPEGKKVEKQRQAEEASARFGVRQPPRLIADNTK